MRAFLEIGGDDRTGFLQGILTQDVTKLDAERILFAALLSPQGKLLHDMFLIAQGDTILLDTDAASAELLRKRLALYKLRAKVTLRDATAEWQWQPGETGLPDPRHPQLPHRIYTQGGSGGATIDTAQRVALGIPAFGADIAPDTITAMDAGYDLLHAISFTKGCYVGQEVTARMHYKSIARKGFFRITAEGKLADGATITREGRAIGTLSSAIGAQALAFLKFDDAVDGAFCVDNAPVRAEAPGWMQPKLALFTNARANQ